VHQNRSTAFPIRLFTFLVHVFRLPVRDAENKVLGTKNNVCSTSPGVIPRRYWTPVGHLRIFKLYSFQSIVSQILSA